MYSYIIQSKALFSFLLIYNTQWPKYDSVTGAILIHSSELMNTFFFLLLLKVCGRTKIVYIRRHIFTNTWTPVRQKIVKNSKRMGESWGKEEVEERVSFLPSDQIKVAIVCLRAAINVSTFKYLLWKMIEAKERCFTGLIYHLLLNSNHCSN